MELDGPEVGRGWVVAASSMALLLVEKLGFHDWALITCCWTSWATWSAAALASDCTRYVPERDCGEVQRSAITVCGQQCLLGGGIFSQAGRQCQPPGMVTNKDNGTGEAQAFAQAVGIPDWPQSPPTTRSAGVANYEIIARPAVCGPHCLRNWRSTSARLQPVTSHPALARRSAWPVQIFGDAVGRDVFRC